MKDADQAALNEEVILDYRWFITATLSFSS